MFGKMQLTSPLASLRVKDGHPYIGRPTGVGVCIGLQPGAPPQSSWLESPTKAGQFAGRQIWELPRRWPGPTVTEILDAREKSRAGPRARPATASSKVARARKRATAVCAERGRSSPWAADRFTFQPDIYSSTKSCGRLILGQRGGGGKRIRAASRDRRFEQREKGGSMFMRASSSSSSAAASKGNRAAAAAMLRRSRSAASSSAASAGSRHSSRRSFGASPRSLGSFRPPSTWSARSGAGSGGGASASSAASRPTVLVARAERLCADLRGLRTMHADVIGDLRALRERPWTASVAR